MAESSPSHGQSGDLVLLICVKDRSANLENSFATSLLLWPFGIGQFLVHSLIADPLKRIPQTGTQGSGQPESSVFRESSVLIASQRRTH
jgi:hypothetical protein